MSSLFITFSFSKLYSLLIIHWITQFASNTMWGKHVCISTITISTMCKTIDRVSELYTSIYVVGEMIWNLIHIPYITYLFASHICDMRLPTFYSHIECTRGLESLHWFFFLVHVMQFFLRADAFMNLWMHMSHLEFCICFRNAGTGLDLGIWKDRKIERRRTI